MVEACEPTQIVYTTEISSYARKGCSMGVRDSIKKPFIRQRGEKKKKEKKRNGRHLAKGGVSG